MVPSAQVVNFITNSPFSSLSLGNVSAENRKLVNSRGSGFVSLPLFLQLFNKRVEQNQMAFRKNDNEQLTIKRKKR